MKKFRALVGSLAVLALGSALTVVPAFGADDGTVPATVTVAAPCLTVSQTTAVDYGVLGFNNSANQSLGTVTNCSGGSSQTLHVRGTTATSAATTWDLNGRNCMTPTLNRYDHRLSLTEGEAKPLNGWYLSTTDHPVATAMGPGAVWNAQGTVFMPCSGSDGQGETFSFSVVFTATF